MSQVAVKSPYSEHFSRYAEAGLPALPVSPGTKVPGFYESQQWHPMRGWQTFATVMPTEAQQMVWGGWEGAGLCVPMGGSSRILAIDVDTNRPDIIAAIEAELAGLLISRRRGARGYAAFVIAPVDFKLTQTKWDVDGQRVLDLLYTGRQVVMPPTIHPDTKQPYTWLTPFKIYDRDELPPCPVDLVERCQRAIAPFQNADDVRKQVEMVERAAHVVNHNDNEGRQINEAALADLDRWLPALIPPDYLTKVWGGYRIKPWWRGVTDDYKVSVRPEGIKDFAQERGYTAIDLVMAVFDYDARKAMDWLAPKVGIEREIVQDYADIRREIVGDYFTASAADIAAEQLAKIAAAQLARDGIVIDDGKTQMKPLAKESEVLKHGLPNELLSPPGVLAEIVQWMLATAESPLPEMSIQAAIAFGSVMAGQLYEGPTGLRSNLNMIGIARSTFGKDHPQRCLKHLLAECGQLSVLGGTEISSGQAIISMLSDAAAGGRCIYVIDEIDGLLAKALQKNAPPHQREIASRMMELYSASIDPAYKGPDKADRRTNKTELIPYPHLTFIGFTTPTRFWEAVKGGDVRSGFINRMLVCRSSDIRPETNERKCQMKDMPKSIVEWGKKVRNPGYAAEDSMTSLGANASNPIAVQFKDDKAEAIIKSFKIETREMGDRMFADQSEHEDAVGRWNENALRLALIAAVAKYPDRPAIDEECAQWAVGYSRHCGRSVLAGIEHEMFDSDFDGAVQQVRAFIMKCGEWGATIGKIANRCRAFKSLNETMADQVFKRLIRGGMIEQRQITRSNGRTVNVYVAIDSNLEDEE